MSRKKTRLQAINYKMDQSRFSDGITLGTVVDTNDPQQMGRLRVVCPGWNDSMDSPLSTIPWASYASPLGGITPHTSMGPDKSVKTDSVTAYGMWAIPKIGAQVLVMCVDGNPNFRVWIGCLYTQSTPHTMPHGRFSYQDSSNLSETGKPAGPFSTQEEPILPLYNNLQKAFGTERNTNYEWRTRGADFSVAAVDKAAIDATVSSLADDKDVEVDGFTVRTGYGLSRIQPDKTYEVTGKNYDSLVYGLTTPGFHAFSMDDREENCRIRIRTTSGHQIILDDTNERIYISTAEGNNWIEMDQAGNIDIHSERRISVHSAKDINFTTNESFRVTAKEIHLRTSDSVNIQPEGDLNLKSTNGAVNLQSGSDMNFESGGSWNASSDSVINLKSGGSFNATASNTINLNASGNILATGSSIFLNGPSAASAGTPTSAAGAYTTNRVPLHEPYARIMISKSAAEANPSNVAGVLSVTNTSSILDISYSDPKVGRQDYSDEPITRGPNWRR